MCQRKLYYQIIKYNNQMFDNFSNFCYNIYVRRREEIGVNRPYPPRTRAFLQLGSPPVAARLPVFFYTYSNCIQYPVYSILYFVYNFTILFSCKMSRLYTVYNAQFHFHFQIFGRENFFKKPYPETLPLFRRI